MRLSRGPAAEDVAQLQSKPIDPTHPIGSPTMRYPTEPLAVGTVFLKNYWKRPDRLISSAGGFVGGRTAALLILLVGCSKLGSACFATFPIPFFPPSPPVIAPPPPMPLPPLPPQQACCPPLSQQLSTAGFLNGALVLTYDDIFCRRTVTATCNAPPAAIGSVVAIVVNHDNFLVAARSSVSYAASCNSLGQWTVGSPMLVASNIECVVPSPAPAQPPPPPFGRR